MMNCTITLLNLKDFFNAVPSTNFNSFGIKFLPAKNTCRQNDCRQNGVGKVIATPSIFSVIEETIIVSFVCAFIQHSGRSLFPIINKFMILSLSLSKD
jgi:hypothetical protein